MVDKPQFSHYHVTQIGAIFPIPPVICPNEQTADAAILKMTEKVFVRYGILPKKVENGIVYLEDGTYIRKRGCVGECMSHMIGEVK